jgi:hypothetical protein
MDRTSACVATLACGLLFALPPARAETSDTARAAAAKVIKAEFDVATRAIGDAMRANPNLPREPRQVQIAIDSVKSIFYNKAYNHYLCQNIVASESGLSDGDRLNKFQDCYNVRNVALQKHITALAQYAPVLVGQPEKAESCMEKGRLTSAEAEFPPFDFLKQTNGKDALFDYAKVLACLQTISP